MSDIPRIVRSSNIRKPLCCSHFASYPKTASLPQLRQFTATQSTPPNWNRAEDRRRYFDFVRAQIGLSFESLYKLTIKAIVQSLPGKSCIKLLFRLFDPNMHP